MKAFNSEIELGEAIKNGSFVAGSYFEAFKQTYSTYTRCCKCIRGAKRQDLRSQYLEVHSISQQDIDQIKTAVGDSSVNFSYNGGV